MWGEPTKEKLSQIPKLSETDHIPFKEKIVHMHFFIFECDWYIVETDGVDICFCYAILNNDFEYAEWGYVSLADLKSVNKRGIEVEYDLYWDNRPACEVENICIGMGWQLPNSKKSLVENLKRRKLKCIKKMQNI